MDWSSASRPMSGHVRLIHEEYGADVAQDRRSAAFEALHGGPEPFVVPNPEDAGTARLMASLGFAALVTTSGAHAGRAPHPRPAPLADQGFLVDAIVQRSWPLSTR